MAGKIHDEQLKLDIIINGNDAQKKLGDLEKQRKEIKKTTDDLRKAKTKLVAEGKKETEEFERLSEELRAQNKVLKQNEANQKELREELGLSGLTTKQLISEQKRLKGVMGSFTPGTEQWEEYNKELQKVDARLEEVKNEMKGVQDVLNDDKAFSEAKEALTNLFSGIKTGDIAALKQGFDTIKTGILGAAKAGLAFIATPIGATLAFLAATLGAGKMWFDYNVGLSKTLKLTEQLTNLQGKGLSDYRAQVQGVAETFDQEYNEVLRASNALAKQMKISQTEALDLVQQGFVRGADAQGKFLDNLKEYPVQFKNAGYSAQDFIDIATQEATGGVFNDKLIDTIKEMSLSLKELDKAQIDVLNANFGEKYASELIKGIDKGQISSKQAFESIILESKKVGLTVTEQQKLVADIFKAAGEDAGGFAEVVFQINEAFKEENKLLTENEKATQRLAESNRDNEKALADLFDASKSGFPAMLTNLKAIGNEIFTNTLRGFHKMFTSIEQLKKQAGFQGEEEAVKRISENMKLFGTTAKEEVETQLKAAVKNINRIKKELDNVGVFGSLFGSKTAYEENLSEAESYYKELLKIKDGASSKFKEHQKKSSQVDDLKPKEKSRNSESEAKAKAFSAAQKELTKFIQKQTEQRLLNQKFGLEKELALIDIKYQKEIDKAREHGLKTKELEDLRNLEKEELTLKRQKELQERLKLQEEENELEKETIRLEREVLAAETDEERTILLLERTQWIANEQLRIEEDKELARLKLIGATEKEIALLKQKFALKKTKVEDAFTKGKEKADKQAKINELALNKQRVQGYSDMFGNIATLLGKHTAAGKAAAIAQATMNTYQGISEVWSAKSVLPEPFATAAKVVSTATVLASGIGAVRNISSTKVPGYENGLYPVTRKDGKKFNAKLGTTQTGFVTEPTLMDGAYLAGERSTKRNPEMIIDDVTLSKLDPRIPQYIMAVHNGTTAPGFENGKYSSNSIPVELSEEEESPTSPKEQILERLNLTMNQLNELMESGIKANVFFGYEEAQKILELQKENQRSKQNGILS